MPETDEEDAPVTTPVVLIEYTCERCGFKYNKAFDFSPFLCYRCMRFIAKRVFVTMNTITPPARTEREDI
jgi:hypothetical protein